jgi:putative Mg2+ transporter-C (MgtC) family protein
MPFDLNELPTDLIRLMVAFILALPIGYNREKQERSAGIRTFPIVAIASCGLSLLAVRLPDATAESASRVLQGLIAGIGFIGGGAILKDRGGVTGTATAASIWNVGVVGAAVGMGMYQIGITLSIVNLLTLKYLAPFKTDTPSKTESPIISRGQPHVDVEH